MQYTTALRTCRNFLVLRQGGVTYRPGLAYVDTVKDSTQRVRLIRFVFNVTDTLVLEFGNLYVRFVQDGAPVVVSVASVPAWFNATAYIPGSLVSFAGVAFVCILANTNQSPPNATYWYPLSNGVYEIPTPYVTADLQSLNVVQSGDIVTIVHPNYPPAELQRFGDADWVYTPITFGPSLSPPTGVIAAAGAGGSFAYAYKVTAVSSADGTESLASALYAIVGANPPTPAAPNNVGWVAVTQPGVAQPTQPTVTPTGATGAVTWAYRIVAHLTGGTNQMITTDPSLAGETTTGVATLTLTHYNLISWTAVPGATSYDIYRIVPTTGSPNPSTNGKIGSVGAPTTTFQDTGLAGDLTDPPTFVLNYNVYLALAGNGVFGLIGQAIPTLTTLTPFFNDTTGLPDFTTQPPLPFSDFTGAGNYPSVVGYYQQRVVYAATNNNPSRVWASQTGNYHYFNKQTPIADDSPIVATLSSDEIDQIMHLVVVGKVILGTQGAEWLLDGDPNGVLTPTSVNARVGSYNGASALRPVKVDSTVLYVQALLNTVLALKVNILYGYYTFTNEDLTLFSSHLFKGFTIVDWAYQQAPNYTVWAVRSDGVLLSLTYLPEQQLAAWTRHDTLGAIENVCVVPEGSEDAVYVVVNRTINNQTVRYIERLATLDVVDPVADPVCVDAGLEYDGRNQGVALGLSMTLSGGTDWTFDEALTLTASGAFFTGAMVGDQIVLAGQVKATISSVTSATSAVVFPNITVPVGLQNASTTTWDHAVLTVTGLSTLEGEQVSVYADGFVVGSPNNSGIASTFVVVGGQLTLDTPYAHIWVGLPYIGDLETLDIDTPQGQSLKDTKMDITRLGLYVESSRGSFVGRAFPDPTDPDPLDGFDEIKFRTDADSMDDAPPSLTEYMFANIQGTFNRNGRVCVRHVDPIPLTVLAIIPNGFLPDGR